MKNSINDLITFVCPITRQLINEVAITSDGFFYEKSAIEQWLKSNNTSPQTGLIIKKVAYPFLVLQKQLDEFYINNPLMIKKRFLKPTSHRENLPKINRIIDNSDYDLLLNYTEFDWILFGESIDKLMENVTNDIMIHIINNTLDLACDTDTNKWKPIHYMCQYQSIDVIKLLIDKGVDLECETHDKWRPIHLVCRYRSIDAIKLLVDNEVDLECETDAKSKPIHLACTNQSIDAIKLLVDTGVDLECEDDNKWRPIHYACRFRSIDAIKLLVDNKVNLECETNKKWKPIHIVCHYQSIDAIRWLVDKVCLTDRIAKYYYIDKIENEHEIEDEDEIEYYSVKCNYDILTLVSLNSKCDINEKTEITCFIQSLMG